MVAMKIDVDGDILEIGEAGLMQGWGEGFCLQ